MRFDISIGDVVLYGESPPDGVGYVIKPDGVAGLFGGLDMRRDSTARPAAHGEFPQDGKLASRTVTVEGYVWGRSFDEAWRLAQELNGLGAPGAELSVTVTDELGSRFATAYLARTPTTVPKRVSGQFLFTIHLWMPDPLFYGVVNESVSSGANVTTSHDGNFEAWQRFRVTGDMPNGYWLSGRGRVFEVPGPLNVGQTDEVDFSTGLVLRDGVPVLGTSPRMWSVPEGQPVSWSLTPFGTGSGTATSYLTNTFA